MDLPVADRQEVLDNMVKQMPLTSATEFEMEGDPDPNWALASDASLDGGELGKLFAGEWEGRYPSQSEADLALVKLMLPRCDTPRECWETFKLSKLGERKKAKRSSYARSTVALAAQHLLVTLHHPRPGIDDRRGNRSGSLMAPASRACTVCGLFIPLDRLRQFFHSPSPCSS